LAGDKMIRDPFYRQIIDGLNQRLDPELFERCAAALLRHIYPGLVPVRGGDDAGMDGAIADGDGMPIPLISSTGKAVLANVKRSLNSYLKKGGMRRNVIVATSRELTAPNVPVATFRPRARVGRFDCISYLTAPPTDGPKGRHNLPILPLVKCACHDMLTTQLWRFLY